MTFREEVIGDCRLILGDCREVMRSLPDSSINTCVTSPPYFGLRDYGHENQIGLESTPDQFVEQLVFVFREVWRVLRDDGTLWLNIGDSYASYRDGKAVPDTSRGESQGTLVPKGSATNRMASTFKGTTIKHKDLIGIPWRVAFALQADGWYLRQDIIWHKPNPMPESVTDRCTKAHEYIFLLSKSPNYYYDNDSAKEDAVYKGNQRSRIKGSFNGKRANQDESMIAQPFRAVVEKRNRRSVWTVTTKPFNGAHFATYPPELIEPCILAGCPVGGTVLDPFFGAGTTGVVALNHGRKVIGCELNSDYADIAVNRIREGYNQPNLFDYVSPKPVQEVLGL